MQTRVLIGVLVAVITMAMLAMVGGAGAQAAKPCTNCQTGTIRD